MKLSKSMIKVLRLMAKHKKLFSGRFRGYYYFVDGPRPNALSVEALMARRLIEERADNSIDPFHYELTPAGRQALLEAEGAGAE